MDLINLGYACINLTLKPEKVCCNRTCRLATLQKHYSKGGSQAVLEFLVKLSRSNLLHLYSIIEWHVQNGWKFYRLSSDMFPHISQPELENLMTIEDRKHYQSLEFARDLLEQVGILAHNHQIRLTMHPGPFNQLASPNTAVVEKTFLDLSWQSRVLDIMNESIRSKYNTEGDPMKNSILCLHGGGVYKNKSASLNRWKSNFMRLPDSIRQRIALENCEKGYSVEDLLPVCQELNIPLILDFHHYGCYNHYHPHEEQKPISELLPEILATWKRRNMKPKFHLSDQAPNKMIGAHADYVEKIPEELLQLMRAGEKFDIMVEAKCKDLAVSRLKSKYNDIC